jgi:hypothetical protein
MQNESLICYSPIEVATLFHFIYFIVDFSLELIRPNVYCTSDMILDVKGKEG